VLFRSVLATDLERVWRYRAGAERVLADRRKRMRGLEQPVEETLRTLEALLARPGPADAVEASQSGQTSHNEGV